MTTPSHPNLTDRVLERIKGEHLSPRPRVLFILENYGFWAAGALAVILGAVAFSAALFEVENTEWQLYPATHSGALSFFLESAPFLWALALALFIGIGYYTIRHTKRGYRYPLLLIALGAVLTSIPLGTALYATGLGGEVEGALGDHPPFYRPILVKEHAWWLAPEKGLLGGTIESSEPDLSQFVLKDFAGRTWTINASALPEPDRTIVARGGTVRVAGIATTTGQADFYACFVFPWEPQGVRRVNPPLPVALIASSSVRNAPLARTDICTGLRPYTELRALDESGL